MKFHLSNLSKMAVAAALTAVVLAPGKVRACACGCGIFDVGTSSMFPDGPGGMTYLEFDYQNQYKNWNGDSRAPAANNSDKQILTYFATAGVEYFFDRSWGFELEVPYAYRTFKTESADPSAASGSIASLSWGDMGDMRVKGIYTGFSADMSSGLTFGLKLPTGNYTHNDSFGDVDRDSELGTGSTDLLLGGFHRQHLTPGGDFSWFAQAELDLPVVTRDQYRPGLEVDEAAGIYYSGLSFGKLQIVPLAQIIASERTSDGGDNASGGINSPPTGEKNSGYERVFLSPGIELHWHPFSVYADVELPVFVHVVGNQLVAPALFKVICTYHF